MMSADVEWEPGKDIDLAAGALKGLILGGEHILKLSRDRVPLEEGTLERSGQVTDNGKDTVAVSYDTPYAARQHEDMGAHHDSGRSAKYLETAVADGSSGVLALVAEAAREGT